MSERRDVYMNRKQQEIFYAGARHKRISAARRFGKTDGTLGPQIIAVGNSMPRGAGGIVGASRKQLFARTIPGMLAAVGRFFGLVEGIHYGFGQPPKDVPECLIKPKTYENALWICNGFLYHCLSLSVFGSGNGLTLSALIADECKFLPISKLQGEVLPSLSGNIHPLGNRAFSEYNPYYKSTCFVSDASLNNKGNWLEKEESRLDEYVDEGEFAGYTYRQIMFELDKYADDVIFWNELMRNAERSNHNVIPVHKETKERIVALADAVLAKEGQFKILPPQYKVITKNTVDFLLNYHLIAQDDAELLYNHEYLVSHDEYGRMLQIRYSSAHIDYIRRLRCVSFYFKRASSLDNIDLLSPSYIAEQKRLLPPLVFATSILNLPLRKNLGDGFYCNLDIENVHGYIEEDCPAIDSAYVVKKVEGVVKGQGLVKREYEAPDFARLGDTKDCSLDADVHDDEPLHIAFDYNLKINWVVTSQMYRRDGLNAMNVLSSMFVKDNEVLEQLCDKWSRYYAPHKRKNRVVFYYYDHTAKVPFWNGMDKRDMCDVIIDRLRKKGWDVVPVYLGHTLSHSERYRIINSSLAGYSAPAIRINRENNESLIIAMENCGLICIGDSWKKDKSGEKLITNAKTAEGQENIVPAELRTDGTDAFDTLFVGCSRQESYSLGRVLMPSGKRQ